MEYEVLKCELHEGAGQIEVRLKIVHTELTITYFLFEDVDDWANTHAYDIDGNRRDDLLPIGTVANILDSPLVRPYKLELEKYKSDKRGIYRDS